MRIRKLTLDNFQGIRHLEIESSGGSFSVYGNNGTGKTTVYNAFTWLLYGRPSTNEKNFSPKTANAHRLNHSAELMFETGTGELRTIKKTYREVYKTTRGHAEETFAGHATEYEIDGVPTAEKDYKSFLETVYKNEDLARMLTQADYFAEQMKVADRRRILLKVCGGVSLEEAIAADPELNELPGILEGKSPEDYVAVSTREKRRIDERLKVLPPMINEAYRAIPETAESQEALNDTLKALNADRDALISGHDNSAVNDALRRVDELRSAYRKKRDAYEAESDKQRRITSNRLMQASGTRDDKLRKATELEYKADSYLRKADSLETERNELLEKYSEAQNLQYDGSDICPYCGQTLPEEMIEKAREEFNRKKSETLRQINERGQKCSISEIERLRAEAGELKTSAGEIRVNAANEYEALRDSIQNSEARPPFEETEDGLRFTREIEAAQEAVKEAESRDDTDIKSRIAELERKISETSGKIAALNQAEKQRERVEELRSEMLELSEKYEDLEKGLFLCEKLTRTTAGLLDEKVNSRFRSLRFRLFQTQVNGGIADDCEVMIPCGETLVPFKSANNASRINAGLELIDTLGTYYGIRLPVFIDNAESVTMLNIPADLQVIRLVVSAGDESLRVEEI